MAIEIGAQAIGRGLARQILEGDALALPLEHQRGAIMLRDVVGERHDGLEEKFQAMIGGLRLALGATVEARFGVPVEARLRLPIAIGDGAVIFLRELLDRTAQLFEFAVEVIALEVGLRLGLRRRRGREGGSSGGPHLDTVGALLDRIHARIETDQFFGELAAALMQVTQPGKAAPMLPVTIEEDGQMRCGEHDGCQSEGEFDALAGENYTGACRGTDRNGQNGRDAQRQRWLFHIPRLTNHTSARE